jgi:hypothetical protein
VQHWTSQLGAGAMERSDYDVEGRIVSLPKTLNRATSGYNGGAIRRRQGRM